MKFKDSAHSILVLLFTFTILGFPEAQTIQIPMEPSYWEHDSSTVEFTNHRSVKAVRGKNGGGYQIDLKDHIFEDGTIEFDAEFVGSGFPGIVFRTDIEKNIAENVYIRSFGPVTPAIRTTLQYAAVIDGISMWDLSDEYQAGATIFQEGWNHIKLEVSGLQMNVYVNDMETPSLHVPCLESGSPQGTIALNGNVIYANFSITPNATDDLPATVGYDVTATDPRYLRNWQVLEPVDFPFGRDLVFAVPTMYGDPIESDLPDSSAAWQDIEAERRALVNLSRLFGAGERDQRRLAMLRTTIQSDQDQIRELSLGFSDEVWVFINGQILHVDKNYYGTPSSKYPRSRCTIENSTVSLPLQVGENEILIAVANYFYGWGIIARLDKTEGLRF